MLLDVAQLLTGAAPGRLRPLCAAAGAAEG